MPRLVGLGFSCQRQQGASGSIDAAQAVVRWGEQSVLVKFGVRWQSDRMEPGQLKTVVEVADGINGDLAQVGHAGKRHQQGCTVWE